MKNCPGCHHKNKCPAPQNKQAGGPAFQPPAVAIVGNMNVGKSTIHARLCDNDPASRTYPCTTVSIKSGRIRGSNREVVLTPGIHSMFSRNEDEIISRDIFLTHKDTFKLNGILLVADAKNLKRSLAIALQYAEYGLPMLLDVNMVDEAAARGITIDYGKLAEILGIDVCTSIARENIGLRKITAGLENMRVPARLTRYPDWVELFLDNLERLTVPAEMPVRITGLLILAGDVTTEKYVAGMLGAEMLVRIKALAEEYRAATDKEFSVSLINLYNQKAEQIVREVQNIKSPSKNPLLPAFGDWCTQIHTGLPIAFAVLTLFYLFVGSFGASWLVDTINRTVFQNFLMPWTTKLVAPIPNPFIREMIIDPDFGILPTGIFLALGLVLPVLFCFYIAFGILEASGYLPRLSLLLDRIFQKMGLNGKGVIPLLMGFSCVTMAILTTRLLGTEKERNIVTFILLLGVPCAPLIAVMLILLGKMPFTATLAVFGIIFLQIFVAGIILNRILPGKRTPLLLEIPPIRIPKFLQVIKMSAAKTYFFMKEAVPVFILASLVVFLFEKAGGLKVLEEILRPLVTGLMGLPEKSIQVFIKTMIRRESGAAELEHLSAAYTNLQIVVNLLVMTFITPCINAVIVLFKERGNKTAVAIISSVMLYAIAIGAVINYTCSLLGITFT